MAKLSGITTPSLTFDEGAAASTPAANKVVLYAKADGLLYSKDDAGTETAVTGGGSGSTVAAGTTRLTSGDVTGLNSTSFADVTGVTVTVTTGARRALVCVSMVYIMTATGSAGTVTFDLAIDSTRVGQTYGLWNFDFANGESINRTCTFTFLTDTLSAASHVFKVQYKVSTGTMKVFASTTVSPAIISVVEQPT